MPSLDIDESDKNLSWLLRSLIKDARQDDHISDDEFSLIKMIEKMIWDIESDIEVLIDSGADNLKDQLRKMLFEVLDEATKKANEDGKITSEERVLLDQLRNHMTGEGVSRLLDQYLSMFKE